MASGQVSPKVGKVIDIPANAPTIGTATDGGTGASANVAFTAASTSTGGPIFSYIATSNPGSFTGTSQSSPVSVSGLTSGTSYTFTVAGLNGTGSGPVSSASNSVTISQPPMYESIATVTSTGSSSTLTFSSIPQTYTHLQIRGIGYDTGANTLRMRFNSDSSLNYTSHTIEGSAGSPQGFSSAQGAISGLFVMPLNGTGNHHGAAVIDIADYANSSRNKVVQVFSGVNKNTTSSQSNVFINSGMWINTAAITSITLYVTSATLSSQTSFALYGIKGA